MLVFNILNSDNFYSSTLSLSLSLSLSLHPFLFMSLIESAPLREWGTRYDSLSTSPSPSTTSSLSRNPPTTICTSTSTANSSLVVTVPVPPAKFHAQGDNVSHEASVFVGSLPTNVDHAELSARLKDHLSAFVEVNIVRVIRDSRGGVCAFVQCNNPASASKLIQTVHSLPPQSFMGRYLRFEPARSQRTLWVSYRKPIEVIHDQSASSSDFKGRVIEFDLPKAMRIYRTPGSKRINVLYNAQALQFDDNVAAPLSHPQQEQDSKAGALSGVGLVLSPLQFDSQTLRQIASSFGVVESFDLRQPEPAEDSEECLTFPYPHNANRSAGMDAGCWEIKWENRNDCLSALTTLRNVPHLTVTWPNQQHALIRRRGGPNRGHHLKAHLMFKRQSNPQQTQPRSSGNSPMTSCIVPL
ncbi:hypothetical protein BGW80DRAFT_49649 [Lactifluus volemus]|nr:hypothetical protein BGW80DRAFT_49649 [Lactifluus volemus]